MIKDQLIKNRKIFLKSLRILILVLLLLGLFFRFINLDRKLYWGDEVFTSLQLSGHTRSEMNQHFRDGRVISVAELQKYQFPNSDGQAIDVVKVLAKDDSQHVPLYHVMAWFWVNWFGDSVTVIRSLSAFISLLAFPAVYWLCQELFGTSLVGWMAIVLIAISPFHVLYAQEARPYTLYIVLILFSGAALLRAMRLQTKTAWGIYGIALILGLYTQIFFALVAIGHGIYVLGVERLRWIKSKSFRSYLVASLLGILAFTPWIWVLLTTPRIDAKSWAGTSSTFISSLVRWFGILSRPFIDLGVAPSDGFSRSLPLILPIVLLFAIAVYSFWFLYKTTAIRVWLFIFALVGVTGFAFMLPDFVLGLRLATTRFLTPCILGMQLSIAYLLATKSQGVIDHYQKMFWQWVTIVLISAGILSCAISSNAEMWWNKGPERNEDTLEVARIVNRTDRPLVISDGSLIQTQVLGHQLDQKVQLQLINKQVVPEIPSDFSEIFLFNPSESLRTDIEETYLIKVQRLSKSLWKLDKLPTIGS